MRPEAGENRSRQTVGEGWEQKEGSGQGEEDGLTVLKDWEGRKVTVVPFFRKAFAGE